MMGHDPSPLHPALSLEPEHHARADSSSKPEAKLAVSEKKNERSAECMDPAVEGELERYGAERLARDGGQGVAVTELEAGSGSVERKLGGTDRGAGNPSLRPDPETLTRNEGLEVGAVSAPLSPESPRHRALSSVVAARAAATPSQVAESDDVLLRYGGAGAPSSLHSLIPNIVIEQVSARDHIRTPPFISSSWWSPWQLAPPPRRQQRTNSDSALYDTAERSERQLQSSLSSTVLAWSVSSVSDAIHLEQIRLTDSPCFSPTEMATLSGRLSLTATHTGMRPLGTTSSTPTRRARREVDPRGRRVKSDSDTCPKHDRAARSSVGAQLPGSAMETGPGGCSLPGAVSSHFARTVDLPESKLQATGSLFQRRLNPVPMEIGSDNGGSNSISSGGSNNNNHNVGDNSSGRGDARGSGVPREQPRISVETSDTSPTHQTRMSSSSPVPSSLEQWRTHRDESLLSVSTLEDTQGFSQGEESRGEGVGGGLEAAPHSPKTAWLRRHSDSNLPVDKLNGLGVAVDTGQRSHSTGETGQRSMSEAVEGAPADPTSSRTTSESSDCSAAGGKRVIGKVKQYLTKRYELDMESPPRLRTLPSIESDDVFSPSPGVFFAARRGATAFSFSPERDSTAASSQRAQGSSEQTGEGSRDLVKGTENVSFGLRRVDKPTLFIRTDEQPPDTPLSAFEESDVETPVFFSPTPGAASLPHQGTVFQFLSPHGRPASVHERFVQRAGAERTLLPMSPLAAGHAASRTLSYKQRTCPIKSPLSQPSGATSPSQSHTSQVASQQHGDSSSESVHLSEAALHSRDISSLTSAPQEAATISRVKSRERLSPMDTSSSPAEFSRVVKPQALYSGDPWRLAGYPRSEPAPEAVHHAGGDRSPRSSSADRGEAIAREGGSLRGSLRDMTLFVAGSRDPVMPTIREHTIHSSHIEVKDSAPTVSPAGRRRDSDPRTDSAATHSPFPTSPTSGGATPLEGSAGLEPELAYVGGGLTVALTRASLAAEQMARVAGQTQPVHSYLHAFPHPGYELLAWPSGPGQAVGPSSPHHSYFPPHPSTAPLQHPSPHPRTTSPGVRPIRGGTPPRQQGRGSPSSTTPHTKERTDSEGGSGGKIPGASKIIYCPYGDETKSQRYQQDPNKNFECLVCGQIFPTYTFLANHMVNHLPSETISKGPGESNKIHICRTCNKSFSRSDMLTRHMRLHTGLRPYECRICGQVFSRSDHLHTHNRTHTGEKPYRCPHCPYAAPRRDMITRHMRIHQKQWPKRGRRSSSTGSTEQSSSFSSSQALEEAAVPPLSGLVDAKHGDLSLLTSSQSKESGECEGPPGSRPGRQSHSLSSVESLESPGLPLTPGGEAGLRHSLPVLEHHLHPSRTGQSDVDSALTRARQWSSASGESYEASDEMTPSTPGSAAPTTARFFSPPWPPSSAAHSPAPPHRTGSSSELVPAPAEPQPASPKKRQWSEMSQVEEGGPEEEEELSAGGPLHSLPRHPGTGGSLYPVAPRSTLQSGDVLGARGEGRVPSGQTRPSLQAPSKFSTESWGMTDTDRTLGSLSSYSDVTHSAQERQGWVGRATGSERGEEGSGEPPVSEDAERRMSVGSAGSGQELGTGGDLLNRVTEANHGQDTTTD